MNKFRIFILALTVVAEAAASMAQTVNGPMSLEQCTSMALEQNAKMRTSANELASSKEVRKEAFTKYFPEVAATGMAFKSNRNMVDFGLLDLINVSFLNKGHAGGVQFVQPVFMGGQIVNGNKLAEVGEAVAKLQALQSRDDVVKTTAQYFYEIVALQAKQKTLQAAQRTVDSLTTDIQAALRAGVTTLNDLLEVQLRANQFRADSVTLANGLALSKMLLAQYIGLGNQSIEINCAIAHEVPELPLDIYRIPEAALPLTPQYGLLEKNIRATELKRRMVVGENLPQVAVGGGLYHYDVMDLDRSFASVFVGVNIPLSAWWGGSHAIKKAKLEEANAKIKFQNDSELLCLNMRHVWDDLTAAQRRAALSYESIGQAGENLRIYQAFYSAGTTTITDLLQAQALYRQAQDQFSEALASFEVARVTYLIATAQIM